MYDGLGVRERVEKFDVTHGLNAIVFDGWLLFADGASREINPMGALCEPPADPFACSKIICKYWEVKLYLAVEEFRRLKKAFVQQTQAVLNEKYCPPPPADEKEVVQQLKQLKTKVQVAQKEFDKARADLEKNKPAVLRQRELDSQENRQRCSEFLSAVEKIEV